MKKTAAVSSFVGTVRDPKRFTKLEDGWIRDHLLSVEWGPSSTEEYSWKEAQEYCKKQGGRLPEIEELKLLADHTKREPAINKIFTDQKSSWYWSGTPLAGSSDFAWVVGFYRGGVSDYTKGYYGYVRPVRSSQ